MEVVRKIGMMIVVGDTTGTDAKMAAVVILITGVLIVVAGTMDIIIAGRDWVKLLLAMVTGLVVMERVVVVTTKSAIINNLDCIC